MKGMQQMSEPDRKGGARVLLVSTNRERQPYPVVPNGLACVASALDAAGHLVRFLDLCFASDPVASARRAAAEFKPDIIGVSVRNIDNSDAIALRHYTPEARSILHALRQAAPDAKVIAGGAAFGVAPEALFRDLGVDYAVAGDGERASVALVNALSAGASIEAMPGLVRDRSGTVAFTPPGEDADLDSLPRPSLHRWIDLARYQRHGATIPIQTKRGCVYKCVYCTYRNVEGWGYRTRDPELVADEIEELSAKAGVHHFDFVDSTFNSPQPSTHSRTASAPFSWPLMRGRSRVFAQRPLPSMIMAMWRGTVFVLEAILTTQSSDPGPDRRSRSTSALRSVGKCGERTASRAPGVARAFSLIA